jgi:hypothetical protein
MKDKGYAGIRYSMQMCSASKGDRANRHNREISSAHAQPRFLGEEGSCGIRWNKVERMKANMKVVPDGWISVGKETGGGEKCWMK